MFLTTVYHCRSGAFRPEENCVAIKEHEKSYFRFLRNLPGKFKNSFYRGIFLYALGIIIAIIIPLEQRNFIDVSIEQKNIAWNSLLLLGLAYGASIITQKLNTANFRTLRMKIVNYYYRVALRKLWTMPKESISRKGLGYYDNILISGCQNLGILVAPQNFLFIFLAVQAVVVLIIAYSWSLPIGILFTALMGISAINTFLFRSQRNNQINIYKETSDDLVRKGDDYIANVKTYKTYGDFYSASSSLFRCSTAMTGAFGKFLKSLENNRFIAGATESLSLFLTLVLGILALTQGKLSYGQMIALVSYCSVVLQPFEAYVTFLGDLAQYGTYVTRYEDAFGRFGELQNDTDAAGVDAGSHYVDKAPGTIEFRNVRADYQGEAAALNFRIDGPVAIIGLSGEGKTTIARLLFRDITPASGEILIDEHTDLASLNKSSWIGSLAVLGQEEEIFNADLEYNILMGKTLVPCSEMRSRYEELRDSLGNFLRDNCAPKSTATSILAWHYDLVDLDERIFPSNMEKFKVLTHNNPDRVISRWMSLLYVEKEQYESVVGQLGLSKLADRVFGQNGESLSGGEKQRISLARFLLKSNFDFFILDEPFHAMDAILEAECTALLSRKIAGKSGMIITHKIHLAETLAHKIVYISNGRVEASGSARELVAGCASYRNLRDTYFANVLKDSDRGAAAPVYH